MSQDFPTTRRLIASLPHWVEAMATLLPKPVKTSVKPTGFRWRHQLESLEVVQVAKAVRMVSGVRAALDLADRGFTVECATLLRTVSDFASEIIFLSEAVLSDKPTRVHSKFVEDHFKPLPTSPDELAEREREYYVGRKDIHKALARLAEGAGISSADLAKISAFLNKGYDAYVHGAYETAMELFTGRTHRFMMTGHESLYHRCIAKTSVAGKLYEVLAALQFMAITRRLPDLATSLGHARKELDESEEQTETECSDYDA